MQNQGTKILETERLVLRRFCLSDAEPMFENWASDSKVTEFLTWQPHKNVKETKTLLEDWIARYSNPSFYNWVIEWKETNEIIGNISVVKLEEKIESADIGYCMGTAWWGRAIMPEALRAVIAYLLKEVGLNRVAANHDSNNPKSGRVMEKAGMKLDGVLRGVSRNRYGISDKVWYSVLKEEW